MRKRVVFIHIISWIAYGMIMIYWRSRPFEMEQAILLDSGKIGTQIERFGDLNFAISHSIRSLIMQAIIFYVNFLFLLPKLFEKGRYGLYVVSIVMTISAANYTVFISNNMMPRPAPPEKIILDENGNEARMAPSNKFMGPQKFKNEFFDSRHILMNIFQSVPSLFFSTLLWMVIQHRVRIGREVNLKNETLQTEMKFLKSQINPHFLFNALNNIYSLSYTQSQQAPQMILKLSDMLRHVVYETESKRVALKREIEYIQNYIDFQKLRIGEDINVTFNISNIDQSIPLEPMLLVPFVENAFKHGDLDQNPDAFLKITLEMIDRNLLFTVENSTPLTPSTKDAIGGIGIENVQKRLSLAYPDAHNFYRERTGASHTIKLKIRIS